jgi:hypothetical protein
VRALDFRIGQMTMFHAAHQVVLNYPQILAELVTLLQTPLPGCHRSNLYFFPFQSLPHCGANSSSQRLLGRYRSLVGGDWESHHISF